MRLTRTLLPVLLLLCAAISAPAQRWSYIYIQGDKQTPFYVKLEDEMLPRYGKNYYIIPELEAGPVHLRILFQQNEFPPQDFTVLVPENGYRGFLLTRKDNAFALYDIRQRFYLMPGDAGEDHLPEMISVNNTDNRPPSPTGTEQSVTGAIKDGDSPSQEPRFIDDLELNNEHVVRDNPVVSDVPPAPPDAAPQQDAPEPDEEQPGAYNIALEPAINEAAQPALPPADYPQEQVDLSSGSAPIANSDCPEPLGESEFDKLYNSSKDKSNDKKRVAYLMRKAETNCFTTRQVYFLARDLQAESMRYSFLKKVYPRVTDQENFHLLESNLFKTLEWKSYFRLIQH